MRQIPKAPRTLSLICLGLFPIAMLGLCPTKSKAGADVDFGRDVRPILNKHCVECHGPEQQKAGLRLDNRRDFFAGGDVGPVVEPGYGDESELIHRVRSEDDFERMPPKGEGLSASEIDLIRAWIDQGANWPEDSDADAPATIRSDHWSFQPLTRPEPPEVSNPDLVRNPIDAFLLKAIEERNIEPSPEADRRTLIRRLSLDLTGLPPTPEEVETFVEDDAPDAYEALVDRLLASPHYGERWGRHWLDLARYADSDGYEKDSPRPDAFRYRDWVIDAFNQDLPFDQFTIEQLAGDLLPEPTLVQQTAPGFHRNTLTNREGGVDQEEFRVAAVFDRVNTTGTVWLGLTVGCAQCHTHKYDPILQREYYELFAFFNAADETDIPAPNTEEQAAYAQAKAAFDAEHKPLKAAVEAFLNDELPARQADWEQSLAEGQGIEADDKAEPLPVEVAEALAIPVEQRIEEQKSRLTDYYRTIDAELLKREKAVAEHAKKAPKPPEAKILTFAERSDPRPTHMLIRGDFLQPGEAVEPGTPGVLHALESESETPNRLDLARWLMAPENPLTARVAVNRTWYHLFGRALVPTVEDFGLQGDPPSHPELLDWLATEYPRLGWSHKALIKTIVLSATYRQSSAIRPELIEIDPQNVWLARQNRFRLEAEIVRDVSLAASGLLSSPVGGPSVRPPQPSGISDLTYAGSAKWEVSEGADRYRRGMYTFFRRTSPYPMLLTFDAPEANVCDALRERSNTPLQALTLLNDEVFVECAQALARRVFAETDCECVEMRLARAFQLCLSRDPTEDELSILQKLHDGLLEHCRANPESARLLAGEPAPEGVEPAEAAVWVALARTILNLDEFVTRE
ncbi:PSD1 and planctomycete cytochrome C domain-containing protein [soil metagenome]